MKTITVISAVWCPSCLILKKHLKKLKKEYDIDYEILDYDLDEEEIKQYEIGNVLPVIIYENKKLIGEKSYKEITDFLKECELIWKRNY